MLKVNNLVKDYVIDSDTVRVLKGVSFDIKDGEILGIIGRSGGGKSTILKVLRGMEPFSEGSFELDGFTVRPDATHADITKLHKMTAIHLQRISACGQALHMRACCGVFMLRYADLSNCQRKAHHIMMNYMRKAWNI